MNCSNLDSTAGVRGPQGRRDKELPSHEHMQTFRITQGGFDTNVVSAPRSSNTVGVFAKH
jgi:hypothetical protein